MDHFAAASTLAKELAVVINPPKQQRRSALSQLLLFLAVLALTSCAPSRAEPTATTGPATASPTTDDSGADLQDTNASTNETTVGESAPTERLEVELIVSLQSEVVRPSLIALATAEQPPNRWAEASGTQQMVRHTKRLNVGEEYHVIGAEQSSLVNESPGFDPIVAAPVVAVPDLPFVHVVLGDHPDTGSIQMYRTRAELEAAAHELIDHVPQNPGRCETVDLPDGGSMTNGSEVECSAPAASADVETPSAATLEAASPGEPDGYASGSLGPDPDSPDVATDESDFAGDAFAFELTNSWAAATHADLTWFLNQHELFVIDTDGSPAAVELPTDFRATTLEPGENVLWVGGYFATTTGEDLSVRVGDAAIVKLTNEGSAPSVLFRDQPDTASAISGLALTSDGTVAALISEAVSTDVMQSQDRLVEVSTDGTVERSAALGSLSTDPPSSVWLIPINDAGAVVLVQEPIGARRILAPFAEDGQPPRGLDSLDGDGVVRFVSRNPSGRTVLWFVESVHTPESPLVRTVQLSFTGRIAFDFPLDRVPSVELGVPISGTDQSIFVDEHGRITVD